MPGAPWASAAEGVTPMSTVIDVEFEDQEALQNYLEQHHLSDGLPVVPPTEGRVDRILEALGVDRGTTLRTVGPLGGELTWENLIANCIMAGCDSQHVPLVEAGIRAVCSEEFNIDGVQGTTGPHAPLMIVNGPVRSEVDLNCATNCLGSGTRANAVIGRAVRLVMQNVGGGVPGLVDMATIGHPGKYSFCLGENEEASPWESLASERGFGDDQSTVTVVACDAPQAIVDNSSTTASQYLKTIRGSLRNVGFIHYYMFGRGQELTLLLSPERASELAQEGWTKKDVKQFIYEAVRLEKRELVDVGMYGNRTWPSWVEVSGSDGMVPVVDSPERVILFIAGGPGRLSAVLPTWQDSKSVTVALEKP